MYFFSDDDALIFLRKEFFMLDPECLEEKRVPGMAHP